MKYTQIKGATRLVRLANDLKDCNEDVQDEITRIKMLKGEEFERWRSKYGSLIETVNALEDLTTEIMNLEIPNELIE